MKKRLYAFLIAAALCFPSIGAMAWWQSVQQVGIAGGTPFSIAKTADLSDTVGGTTVAYSGSIGAADTTRVVIADISSRGPNAVIGVGNVNLCGVTATAVVQSGATNSNISEIWKAAVPTGTTCSVSITYPNSTLRSVVSLYSMIGQSGGAPVTASTIVNANPLVVTLTIPSGGFVVTTALSLAASTTTTPALTPGTITADGVYAGLGASTTSAITGHSAVGAVTGSTSVTVTWTGGTGGASGVMAAAAWGP